MAREDQIINERKRKITELRKAGINPYPYKFDKKNSATELQDKYKKIKADSKTKNKVKIAGRLMTKRDLGKLAFATLRDGTGDIQLLLRKGDTPEKIVKFFKKYIDAGDFIGVEGLIIKTKRGELSVLVKKIEILTKSILPLPEKWHGLQDKEDRYRKRYLDLIMNPEVKDVFEKRSKIIQNIRNFLVERGFLEVDTPILQPLAGGAIAKPFKAHYNAYDTDVYLRIAPELYLKKLLIGGFDKVFEVSRCFRNEGVDWSHNPEFINLEFYQAYADYNDMMKLTEEIICGVAKEINYKTIKIKKPFKRIEFSKLTKGKMTDEAFKEAIKDIKEPTFVINHPIEFSPLAKKNDNKTVQRFQLIINGIEMANAFSELNDPIDQEERFKEQAKKKGEKHEYDADFVEALKYGMPPAGGVGIGIDRLIMLFTGKESLREVLLFPFMKPEEEGNKK
jgi:lysyl-tRNA synthetase class 2